MIFSLLLSTRLDLGLLFVLVVGIFFVFYATNPFTFFGIVAMHDLELEQLDVKTAFLN